MECMNCIYVDSAGREDIRSRWENMASDDGASSDESPSETASPEVDSSISPVQFLHEPKIKILNSPLGEYNGSQLGQCGRSLGGCLIERVAHQKLRTPYKRVEGA